MGRKTETKEQKINRLNTKLKGNAYSILYNLYWNKGKTYREIAKLYDVSYESVRNWLNLLNIPSVIHSSIEVGKVRLKTPKMKELEAELHIDLQEGLFNLYWKDMMTMQEIANYLGVTQTGLNYWFKRLSIPTRSYQEAHRLKWQKKNYQEQMKQAFSSKEHKKKLSKIAKINWNRSGYRDKMMKARSKTQTITLKNWVNKGGK